jgi:hypothetical protein
MRLIVGIKTLGIDLSFGFGHLAFIISGLEQIQN